MGAAICSVAGPLALGSTSILPFGVAIFRGRLDGVLTASVGAQVHHRIGADPVHLLLSGQVSVTVNSWYGPFYDLVQAAVSKSATVANSREIHYSELSTFHARNRPHLGRDRRADAILCQPLIFRWRTAMNDFYIVHWAQLRTIEGASQRVQEDTMRLCDHCGRSRRQSHQRGADTAGVLAGPREAVYHCYRTAGWSASSPIRWYFRCRDLVLFGTGLLR